MRTKIHDFLNFIIANTALSVVFQNELFLLGLLRFEILQCLRMYYVVSLSQYVNKIQRYGGRYFTVVFDMVSISL